MLANGQQYLRRLVGAYGKSFCLLLTSVYFGLKGPVYTMVMAAQLPYFKSIGITGQRFQSFGVVSSTPWAMKALIGIISDSLPIFGWHKRPYILFTSFTGVVALVVLAVVQMSTATAPFAALLLMLVSLQLATVDLLTEGTYAALMASVPETGADVVTFVWALYMAGSFIGSSVAGPVSDYFNPRVIFFVCIPLALQVIPTSAWLPEEQVPVGQRGFRRDKLEEHPKIFLLGLCMTLGAMLLAFVSLVSSSETQSVVSVLIAGGLCVLATMWLPPLLARGNLYMFLASALYVNIGGASDYWFTAPPSCVPNGPHFSFTYYITYAALVGSIAGMAGVTLFQIFLSRGTFRKAFLVTLLLKLLASLFDLFIVNRDNLKFGIPDKLAFMLGDAIIYNVAVMLDFMPAVVLTSASCPKGMEATVYSLLAGFQNFGTCEILPTGSSTLLSFPSSVDCSKRVDGLTSYSLIASQLRGGSRFPGSNVARAIGVGLINYMGIKTTVPCNFDNLPLAILISHVILPLMTVPLIFILIPPQKMTEKLYDNDEDTRGQNFELGQVSEFDDTEDDDDPDANADMRNTEKEALVTQPVDMELDSIYSESERDSMASSFRQGDSLGASPSVSLPISSRIYQHSSPQSDDGQP